MATKPSDLIYPQAGPPSDLVYHPTTESKKSEPKEPSGLYQTGESLAEGLATGLGGVLGTAGGPVGTVAGAGLGYGITKSAEDLLRQKLGYALRPEAGKITTPLTDVMGGSELEMGGHIAGKGLTYGLQKVTPLIESTKAYQQAGNAARKVASQFIDSSTKTRESAARAWEKLGVKVDPISVRGIEPRPSAGLTENAKNQNQRIFNRTFTKDTGVISDTINDEFLNKRFDDLGKGYDSVYKNRHFKIDASTINDLKKIIQVEESLGPAGARVPTQAADTLARAWDTLVGETKNVNQPLILDGNSVLRLRTKLNEIARNPASDADRFQARQIVKLMDQSIASNNPTVGKALGLLNKQYRATSALFDARSTSIDGGDISPLKFGEWLERNPYAGTDTQKMYGQHGKYANLTSRVYKSPAVESTSAIPLYSSITKALNAAKRTQAARNIQRKIADKMMLLPEDHIPTADAKELERLLEQLDKSE